MSTLEGGWRRWEVRRSGVAGHVGIASRVHGDTVADVIATAAEVGGVNQGCRAGGVQLGHEGVGRTRVLRLEGGWRRRKVGRISAAGHVGIASRVHDDTLAEVTATAPEIG